MLNPNEYKEFLLRNMTEAIPASGDTEVVCKCMYCADDGDHHHMYISIPQNEAMPSFFHCFKCNSEGIVTRKKLIEWQIFDMDMSMMITDHNKNLNNNYARILSDRVINLRRDFIRNTELSQQKLHYINSRLGLNLGYQDMIDNKIVLNLNDLLKQNYISNITRSLNMVNELNDSFIGFLSYDNNFVNLRKINDGSWVEQRYINYNIFGKQDNTKKMYILPNSLDLLYPIDIHIAEGPFDILSIKYNLRKETFNQVYCAITGNAYKAVLRELIINKKLMNLRIHLYPDADTKDYVLKDLIQFLSIYRYPIYIHRNLIGKDMGESIDKIKESIEIVGGYYNGR